MALVFTPIHPQSSGIGLCEIMLLNSMRCTRAGEFYVGSEAEISEAMNDNRPLIQVCASHAKMLDAGIIGLDGKPTPVQEVIDNGNDTTPANTNVTDEPIVPNPADTNA